MHGSPAIFLFFSEPGCPSQLSVAIRLQSLQDSLQQLSERYPALAGPPVSHYLSVLCHSLSGQSHSQSVKRSLLYNINCWVSVKCFLMVVTCLWVIHWDRTWFKKGERAKVKTGILTTVIPTWHDPHLIHHLVNSTFMKAINMDIFLCSHLAKGISNATHRRRMTHLNVTQFLAHNKPTLTNVA